MEKNNMQQRHGFDALGLEADPYDVEPEQTMKYLELYFEHINQSPYGMFPQRTFLEWVKQEKDKCQNERMLLYTMITMGSIYAEDPNAQFSRICADIATSAVNSKIGRYSLPLVQSRLILAIYNFSRGKEGLAWDYCGFAFRVIGAIRLNTEEGCGDIAREHPRPYYTMPTDQLVEVARRTYWAAYILDVGPSHSVQYEIEANCV